MQDFHEKTVVVTGGTKGLGSAIARAFHERGAHVVVAAREDNGLAAQLGSRALFQASDVREASALDRLAQAALSWTGRLDVWINNAGRSEWRAIAGVDEEFWRDMIDTNLSSTCFGCRAAAQAMSGGGCILNISSLAGKRGSANNAVYCAAKFGVNGLTQALAKELGPRGIRVNALCPVLITTPGLIEALESAQSPAGSQGTQAFLSGFAASNAALGHLPQAGDVADYCLFLASPQARAITGQCVNVDCGVFPQ